MLYKNIDAAPIFTLKDDTKILKLESYDKAIELAKRYPSFHHILFGLYKTLSTKNTIFDFEELSKEYDDIYIDYYNKNFPEI